MSTTALPQTLPGPRPMWVVGWRGNIAKFAIDPIGYVEGWRQRYGNVFALTRGGMPLNTRTKCFPGSVMAIGPEYNQLVLSDTARFHNGLLLGTEGSPYERLGAGLLNMNGERHRQQRRLIMPAFQKARVESYHDDIVAITGASLAGWKAGQRRDVAPDMRQIALRVAAKALFGLDVSSEADHLGGMIDRWLKATGSPWLIFVPFDLPLSPYRRLMQLSAELDAATRELLARVRHSPAAEAVPGSTGKPGASPANRSILAVLSHARDEDGTRMTEDELIGQANLLFIAGHETTANALTWTLFLLTQHPRVMADLFDELRGTLHGVAPTVDQLNRLPLLERVIKESMRLLPPVPFGARTCVVESAIGPFAVPAGAEIVFSQYFTHHLPELFEEPNRFRPQRWETNEPTAYEYLPFLAGARMCVGATFAMQEIKIVLAMLLQRFGLDLVPNTVVDRRVTMTLSPKHGLPLLVGAQAGDFKASPWSGNVREMVEV